MVIIAQGIMLAGSVFGVLLFIYANAFIFRRLRSAERRIVREEAKQELAAAAPPVATGTQVALPDYAPSFNQEALFYMYHEQVRRFIDAKIDIMRSTAETQNRILLLQAEAMRNSTLNPELGQALPLMIEGHANQSEAVPVPAPVRLEPIALLMEQHQFARREAERHLDAIDDQIRTLPGPSIEYWVKDQALRLVA